MLLGRLLTEVKSCFIILLSTFSTFSTYIHFEWAFQGGFSLSLFILLVPMHAWQGQVFMDRQHWNHTSGVYSLLRLAYLGGVWSD